MKHQTKDGRKIALKDMTLDHLLNTIAWIKRKAEEGLIVTSGSGGVADDDLWDDEYTIYDDEALDELNYDKYMKELSRRKKQIKDLV